MKKFITLVICILLIAVAVLGIVNYPAYADKYPIDWFDCTNKPDGNYQHPADMTRFISCSGGIASERDCATCLVAPVRCPAGRTVYATDVDACLWADEVKINDSGKVESDLNPE